MRAAMIENQRPGGRFYSAARSIPISKTRDLILVLFYIALADAIASTSPRFVALAYGQLLSERYHFYFVSAMLQLGYMVGRRFRPRKTDLRRYFTVGPTMLLSTPILCWGSFTFSGLLGPTAGPIFSQMPIYFTLFYLSVTKICSEVNLVAEVPLIAYSIFRIASDKKLPGYNMTSACNVLTALSATWCASEIVGSYLHYRGVKAKLLPFLESKSKILHAIILLSFGGALTHMLGPLQCSWVLRSKVFIVWDPLNGLNRTVSTHDGGLDPIQS